jgi:hypothetical protein
MFGYSFLLNKFKVDTTITRLLWQEHNLRIMVSLLLDLKVPVLPTCPARVILYGYGSRGSVRCPLDLIFRWPPVDNGIRWLRGNARVDGNKLKVKITIPLFFSTDDP